MSRIIRPSLADIIASSKGPSTLRYRTGHAMIRHRPREFEAHFRVEQIHGPTGFVKQDTGWFRNLIVDAGLDWLGGGNRSVSGAFAFALAGTDNTAPDVTDVNLGATVASSGTTGTGDNVYAWGPSNAYLQYTRVVEFTQGGVVGNIAEIGMASNSNPVASNQTLWSRQVLPVAITFASPNDDILRVTYRVRVYPGQGDPNDEGYWDPFEDQIELTLNEIGPVTQTTDIQSRAINIGTSQWSSSTQGFFHNPSFRNQNAEAFETNVLPAHTDPFTGTFVTASARNEESYTPGTFHQDYTLTWGPSVANGFSTGIGSLKGWGNRQGIGGERAERWVSVFDPKIPKDNTRQVTIVQRVAWGRRAPTDVS